MAGMFIRPFRIDCSRPSCASNSQILTPGRTGWYRWPRVGYFSMREYRLCRWGCVVVWYDSWLLVSTLVRISDGRVGELDARAPRLRSSERQVTGYLGCVLSLRPSPTLAARSTYITIVLRRTTARTASSGRHPIRLMCMSGDMPPARRRPRQARKHRNANLSVVEKFILLGVPWSVVNACIGYEIIATPLPRAKDSFPEVAFRP